MTYTHLPSAVRFIGLLYLAGLAHATAATRPIDPAGFASDQRPPDVRLAYQKVDGIELPMAVFLPADRPDITERRPAILLIHGGAWSAWRGGDYATWDGGILAPHARYFAKRGMVAVNISYRNVPQPGKEPAAFEAGPGLADLIADCRSAVRFLRNNADRFGIDPARIAVLGDSAGGHLAAALGTIDRFDNPGDDPKVSAMANLVVACNPITDLSDPRWFTYIQQEPRPIEEKASREDRAKAVSPLWNVTKDSTRTLAIHGLADTIVLPRHSSELIERMKQCGVPAELTTIPGASHAFVLLGYRSTGSEFLKVMRGIDSFLVRSGYLQGEIDFSPAAPRGLLTRIACDRMLDGVIPGSNGARLVPPDATTASIVDDPERGKALKLAKGKQGLTLTVPGGLGTAGMVALWIKPDKLAGTLVRLSVADNVATGYKLSFGKDGVLVWQVAGATLTAGAPPVGQWTQVTALLATDRAALYLNGKPGAEQVLTDAALIGSQLVVGENYSGTFSDLQVFDEPKAGTEIPSRTTMDQPAAAAQTDEINEVNLASDTAWTLRCDGGAPRPIKVPGGGWNSEQQSPRILSAAVRDHVIYERQIAIPAEAKDKAVKVLFGGCNYGAEVWLDDHKITGHIGPMTPFEADLTGVAKPGKTHQLRVKAFTRMHYGSPPGVPVPFDFNQDIPGVPKEYNGHTKFAYGLIGHVRLSILPAVHVTDVFAQPSVAKQQLTCDVWISNSSKVARRVELATTLSSWNRKTWKYPVLPGRDIDVPAGEKVKVTVAAPWTLGPESYWWPNIPFREDYVATLHWINLTLREAGKVIAEKRQRFGFVEHAEGPYYYTVNGVRYASFGDSNSYGQIGEYDCWTETPCFQPPLGNVKGCPETWKRYQRLGFNSMRLSTSMPTGTMLATADEAGFLLISEGGSWGNSHGVFNRETFGGQLRDTIRVTRNHPSVARHSICNEPREPRNADWCWRGIIDDAHDADPTRPLVMEVHQQGSGRVDGLSSGRHAYIMEHYGKIEKAGTGSGIRGMGECDWGTDKLGDFAVNARKYRLNDWAHFAPWSMVNFWPNLLEGMNHDRHPWKFNNHADRIDGVDGWGSPLVKFLQRSLDPYLVQDVGILAANPGPPRGHEKGQAEWPYEVPNVVAGKQVERDIAIFNGGLSGSQFTFAWSAKWDQPDGTTAIEGGERRCEIQPGFHALQKISFVAPPPGEHARRLFLVMESRKDGVTVFRSKETFFNLVPDAQTSKN